jgi:hypothetical protein
MIVLLFVDPGRFDSKLLLLGIGVVVIFCCDGDSVLPCAQGELILEVPTYYELKGVLQDFFPAVRPSDLGLVTWV